MFFLITSTIPGRGDNTRVRILKDPGARRGFSTPYLGSSTPYVDLLRGLLHFISDLILHLM